MKKVCMKRGCDNIGCHKMSSGFYCDKHHRFFYMAQAARKSKKDIPTFNELEILLFFHAKDMICKSCGIMMKWHSQYDNNRRSKVVSLQHNNIGTMSLICQGCNAAHGQSSLKDQYFNIIEGHKYCKPCKRILPFSRFHNSSAARDGHKTYCKSCRSQKYKDQHKKTTHQTSNYNGVYKRKNIKINDKYIAGIKINNKAQYLGSFDTEEAASVFYDLFIINNNLDFTRYKLNFPCDFYD